MQSSTTRVRKNLSRSNSELDVQGNRQRKKIVPGRAEGGQVDASVGGSPPGLLSCLSIPELSKLELSDAAAAVARPVYPCSRRNTLCNGSLSTNSNSCGENLSCIRVPSQRTPTEMASDRIDGAIMARGRSRSWCQSPSRTPTTHMGRFWTGRVSQLELDSMMLRAVLSAAEPDDQSATPPVSSPSRSESALCMALDDGLAAERPAINGVPAESHREDVAAAPAAAPPFAAFTPDLAQGNNGAFGWMARAGSDSRAAAAHAASAVAPTLPPLQPLICAPTAPATVTASSQLPMAGVTFPPPARPQKVGSCPAELVPTAFQWLGSAEAVHLCGTFNNWGERLAMHKKGGHRGEEWWLVLNLPPGEYAYKFAVHATDGHVEWCHASDQPSLVDALGHSNNWKRVVDQHEYEMEELVRVHEEHEEEGFSQDVMPEFYEMLYAADPPALPAYLDSRPPCTHIPTAVQTHDRHHDGVSSPKGTALPDPDVPPPPMALPSAPSSPGARPTRPVVHSVLLHMLTSRDDSPDSRGSSTTPALEANRAVAPLALPKAPVHLGDGSADCFSAPSQSEMIRAEESRAAEPASLLPPPIVVRTTVRHTLRHQSKFVTLEFVRSARPTSYAPSTLVA